MRHACMEQLRTLLGPSSKSLCVYVYSNIFFDLHSNGSFPYHGRPRLCSSNEKGQRRNAAGSARHCMLGGCNGQVACPFSHAGWWHICNVTCSAAENCQINKRLPHTHAVLAERACSRLCTKSTGGLVRSSQNAQRRNRALA